MTNIYLVPICENHVVEEKEERKERKREWGRRRGRDKEIFKPLMVILY